MRSASKIALPLVVLASGLAASVPAWTESDASEPGSKDIVVEQLGGAVEVTVADVAFNARVGSSLGLPARILTGSDGNIAIRQSRTGVAIAPDSDVEIPAAAREGQLIARMIQHRGTAFYDVEPRPVEKLRIETPYLVAVVKGTQFSVLVQDGRTTVSLFEGLLELRSIDDAEVVELAAGQIAVGAPGGGIQVLPMNADLLPEAAALGQDAAIVGSQGSGSIAAVAAAADVDAIAAGVATGSVATGGDQSASIASVASFSIASGSGSGSGIDAEASLSVGGGLDIGASSPTGAGVDVGLDAGLDAGADLGGGSVDVGLDAGLDAGADLGGGSVDLGLDTALDVGTDAGGGSVDAGLDASLDSGVEVEADLTLGDVAIEAGLDANLDLGELDVGDTLEDLLDPGDDTDDSDTEEDDSLLPDLPLPLF